MSLLGKLLDSAKKADIGYGIHSPVVILKVDNTTRKTKDGEKVKRNCFTMFGKLNKDGKVVAQKEVSWFNVDHKSDFAYQNFFTQLDQITGILDCYYDKEEEDIVAETFDSIFDEMEIETQAELEDAVKDKSQSKELMESIVEAYITLMEGKTGSDSKQLRFKLSYDSKGKYLQQPKYDPFTEALDVPEEDTMLKLSKKDEEYRAKSLVTNAPAAAGGNLNI